MNVRMNVRMNSGWTLCALAVLCLAVPGAAEAQATIPEEPSVTPFTVAPRLLNLPEVVAQLRLEYPASLRQAGIGGQVDIWFYIDDQGRVARRLLNQTSGVEELDRAALEVAGVYRFSPAMNRTNPVGVWVSLPITFEARGQPRTN